MKYYKIFQYAYLMFAVLFLYDGISKWNDGTNGAYISLGLAALAVFMFFFRKKFSKKFDNKDNSN
jgi:ABC-type spermidine/putrescine transport system permease subunit I